MDIGALPADMLFLFLDQFSDSTGDYYLLYDREINCFHFSRNIHDIFPSLPEGINNCPADEWRSVVYAIDLPKIHALTEELLSGARRTYNVNYRIQTSNQLVWVNSRGKTYPGQDGKPRYIMGRVSRQLAPESKTDNAKPALAQELKRLYRNGQRGFLLLVGVDDLQRINRKQGREFGDAVVQALEENMALENFREHSIFRVNGDCFCAILPNADQADVTAFYLGVRQNMREQCTLSAGSVSLQDYQVPDGSVLLQYAESALESAKLAGKSCLRFFSPEDYEHKLTAMELLEELETAVNNNFEGFSLNYQAQVCSESFDLFGAEVLLRFTSPTRGAISPQEFIPILEKSELICPVGLWVLRNALQQCLIWRKTFPQFHVSVNFSYVQLCHAGIQTDVLRILAESGVPGSALTVEVTESMELGDYPHLNTIFSAWKRHGVEISVDDFGTGYSNLRWLKDLAIDEIKIDRCFVQEIQHSAYNLRLLSNIIELAESNHIRVCCEGVETQDELVVLERLHPSIYQGFFFARPNTPELFLQACMRWKEDNKIVCCRNIAQVRHSDAQPKELELTASELEHFILDSTDDIVSISDVETYEVYYLNPTGQQLYATRDYKGRKCYKVFRGLDAPCESCPNSMLRQDSLHVWDDWNSYCGRHFLFKDKLLYLNGKKLRMEIGIDITKREYVSQTAKERLKFSKTIVGYLEILRNQQDFSKAVMQVLASIGDFYQAHRAYLFERDRVNPDHWNNTFEWCAPQAIPQQENLYGVPQEMFQRWIDRFEQNQSVILYSLEPLRMDHPQEYELLRQQDIQRLIAVPILIDGKVLAFIGVDNPHSSIQDDSQIRVLAAFLAERHQLLRGK